MKIVIISLLIIIAYVIMWVITSSIFYIYAVKEYKKTKQKYHFEDWYDDSDYVNFVPLSGLFWPICFWVAIFKILSDIIINKIHKHFNI